MKNKNFTTDGTDGTDKEMFNQVFIRLFIRVISALPSHRDAKDCRL